MKFEELVGIIGDEPVFDAALLKVGGVTDVALHLQLTRWTQAGKLVQLRRGVYALAAPYRKTEPHRFAVANALRRGAYVSLHSALAYHGMIPEAVPVVTSVTTGRSEHLNSAMGSFLFRHVKAPYFFGYELVELGPGQTAFIAVPEKALLDLVYLTPGADKLSYLRELRLQNLEAVRSQVLNNFAVRMGKPKVRRAIKNLSALRDGEDYEEL
jgi:predicted transcriptional regulator of viral defense system